MSDEKIKLQFNLSSMNRGMNLSSMNRKMNLLQASLKIPEEIQ